jgi:hypothetical protein
MYPKTRLTYTTLGAFLGMCTFLLFCSLGFYFNFVALFSDEENVDDLKDT